MFCNCACAAPASDEVEISIVPLNPRPNTCDDDPEDVLDDDEVVEGAFAIVPAAIPNRASASESVGPATRLAVTPLLTAIFNASPPLAYVTVALPFDSSTLLILSARDCSVSSASTVTVPV